MGSTISKLVALAALLHLVVAILALSSPPEPGSFSVMGIEGGLIAHWAFNIQTGLWPAIYLLALATGLEVLRRLADVVEQSAINEEQ